MNKTRLKENVDSAKTQLDNVVAANAPEVATRVPPKTAYSKNITIEEWNQLASGVNAVLQNDGKERDLSDSLVEATDALLDEHTTYDVVAGSDTLSVERRETEDDEGKHEVFALTLSPTYLNQEVSNAVDAKVQELSLSQTLTGFTVNGTSLVQNRVAALTLGPSLTLDNGVLNVNPEGMEYAPIKVFEDMSEVADAPSKSLLFQKDTDLN